MRGQRPRRAPQGQPLPRTHGPGQAQVQNTRGAGLPGGHACTVSPRAEALPAVTPPARACQPSPRSLRGTATVTTVEGALKLSLGAVELLESPGGGGLGGRSFQSRGQRGPLLSSHQQLCWPVAQATWEAQGPGAALGTPAGTTQASWGAQSPTRELRAAGPPLFAA